MFQETSADVGLIRPSPEREPRDEAEQAARHLRVEQRWISPELLVCTPVGELDLLTAPLFQEALEEAHKHDAAVVADLSQLRFMGVVGAEVLLRASEQAGVQQHAVAVVTDTRLVRRVLTLTGTDESLTLYPTLDDAIHATGAGNSGQHVAVES